MPVSRGDFDLVLEEWHDAHRAFMNGDPGPVQAIWSHRHDVSVANPFGGAFRGWESVGHAIEQSVLTVGEGDVGDFEIVAMHVSADLAYVVQIEHYISKVHGTEVATPFSLRATMIFRPEGSAWKLLHRHADRNTSSQPSG